MFKMPAFVPKAKGPLNYEEYLTVTSKVPLKYIIGDVERFFSPYRFRLMARDQVWGPCIYIFYSLATFEDNQQGLLLRCQDLPNGGGFEIVFAEFDNQLPLATSDWAALVQDRYKANRRWKAHQVLKLSAISERRGHELVTQAKARFESIYADILTNYNR